ncbi:MAG: DUF3373 family protein [Sulfuricurvum sp.]
MKSILLLMLSTLLFSAEMTLQERVIFLEKELEKIKQQIKENEAVKQQVTQNTNDIQEALPILERSEKKSILDRVDLSPELELRIDKLHYDLGQIAGENTTINSVQRRDEFSKDFEPAGTLNFKLNMHADIAHDLKFNGRLVFNRSSQSNERLCILSHDIKSSSSLTGIDIDRAYFDYTVAEEGDEKLLFSFGILPTTGGTPTQYSQKSTRKSMFPSLVFDMDTYGIIGTKKFNNNTFVRGVVAKAFTLDPNMYIYQCNRENIDNGTITGLYFDTKFDLLGNAMFSAGINMIHDLKAHPYLGPDITENNSHVLGTMVTYGLGLDIENVSDAPLNLFAHAALSNPHSNGNIDDYQITATNPNGFTDATYATGGLLSSNGYALYTGGKYEVSPVFDVGAEYNHGSKYWFSATQGAEDPYNKLAIRGDAAEIYGIWKFHDYLHLKFGFLYMNEAWTGSGWHFAEPAKKDGEQTSAYLSVKAKF